MKKLLIIALIAGFAFSSNLTKCTGCHGAQFEKKALGKSAVVKDMTKEDIIKDLQGYKAGTLSKHGMGTLMKGQVATLSDKDIEEMAEEIVNLK